MPLTSGADHREHQVLDVVHADALQSGAGRCMAVCGAAVLMVSLSTPPGSPCPACAAALGGPGVRRAALRLTSLTGADGPNAPTAPLKIV